MASLSFVLGRNMSILLLRLLWACCMEAGGCSGASCMLARNGWPQSYGTVHAAVLIVGDTVELASSMMKKFLKESLELSLLILLRMKRKSL